MLFTVGFPTVLGMVMFSFDTPLENATNFYISVTSLATSLKFGLYAYQLHKLFEIESIFRELDSRIVEEQKPFAEMMHKRMRLVTNIFKGIYSSILINSELSFLFRGERTLPFPAWFPLDWSESLINYSLALLYQLGAIFVQIGQNFVDDLFPPLVLCLIAGHCELLIIRVSSIGYTKADHADNDAELVRCIEDQEKLYKLLLLSMDIISLPMLVQFIVTGVDMAAVMFALVFFVEDLSGRLYHISLLFALLCQTFPICFFGTNLEHCFKRLHYASFCSNWVYQSRVYRKNVILFAERTKRHPRLLAGGMVPIELSTFVASCKAAYSFFTLIGDFS
ncbi:odorant receptor 23a [Scaptodrosophila lebanonensis]|uniref:Odorant receptor 23a n=1 Tax=Drosophila lebanonensis TaxID=7225 RepID=A0A6J2U7Z2_DROLE|nr:odorant receptor 23a [Scaptodrosophila lebanonensis]